MVKTEAPARGESRRQQLLPLPTSTAPALDPTSLLRLWQKELSLRVFAELMAQDAKTPGCVAEPLGRLC